MQIAIVGTGYVGLVTGVCFAELGNQVICIDKDDSKITALNNGQVPIYEPGLEELLHKNTTAGRLNFFNSLKDSVAGAEAVFIAVGTPTGAYDGQADLTYVYAAAEELAHHIDPETVVVIKSTVPVHTGKRVKAIITEANPELAFYTASNPEFLREGCAVKDFMEPDRVVVGVDASKAQQILQQLYDPLAQQAPIVFTDITSSELTKYAANAFLATKIAFINEIADICEKAGANVEDVATGMGLDQRIGSNYLKPGPGFGGSCFPKDTRALAYTAEDLGAPSQLVQAVIKSNEDRKHTMVNKVAEVLGGSLKGKKIAVLGLAFKAGTDDMRESAALAIIPQLLEQGAQVQAFDPKAMENAKNELKEYDITYHSDAYSAAEGADAALIITEWPEFQALDFEKLRSALQQAIIVDLRNLFTPADMQAKRFQYISVGRPLEE